MNSPGPAAPRRPVAASSGSFTFEGAEIPFREGQTIAAALIAAGIFAQGKSKSGAPRGVFCGMGVCFDCAVSIDGGPRQRSCLAKATDGAVITAHGRTAPAQSKAEARPPGPRAETDVLVIGAGPAGLAAAESALAAGAGVLVIDERPDPGGQYYKQRATARAAGEPAPDRQMAAGAAIIARLRKQVRSGVTVWAAFQRDDGFEVSAVEAGRSFAVAARQLILATGAYERPALVPGWTLPGVFTTGALQTLIRAYGVSPGKRVLLAGNGPLNFLVALELARAGTEVAAVIEAAPPPLKRIGDVWAMATAAPALAARGVAMLGELRRRRIPVIWRHRLDRIEGEGRAQRAIVADIESGKERSFEIDAVAMGDGFRSCSELARMLGCAAKANPATGELEPVTDGNGLTSVPGLHVVGEAARFGGAEVATAEGALAGWRAAEAIGFNGPSGRLRDQRRAQLARHRQFQDGLWRLFARAPGDPRQRPDEVLVCRCEEVSLGSVRAALSSGAASLPELKRATRCGMGPCQGRYCLPEIAALIAGERALSETDFTLVQAPVKPIPAGIIAAEKPEWRGHRAAESTAPASRPAKAGHLAETDVLIIGAGIIGACTAYFLAAEGIDTLLVDRGAPNGEASGANAGSLHVQLTPFDFASKEGEALRLSLRSIVLHRESVELWRELEESTGGDFEFKQGGGLIVAESEAESVFLWRKAELEREAGLDVRSVDKYELRRIVPAVSDRMVGANLCPQEGKVNPLLATAGLLAAAEAHGARILRRTEVAAIRSEGRLHVVGTSGGEIRARRVVNAAGAWSGGVAALAGLKLPVAAAPMQMVVTEACAPLLDQLLAHAGRHLSLKQSAAGHMLIGGGWTAGIDAATGRPRPLLASIEGNLWSAARVVPAVGNLNVVRSWAGMAVDIDGAPVVGEAKRRPGFFNAVSYSGYTLGPVVGLMTAEMLQGKRPVLDPEPFRLERFG